MRLALINENTYKEGLNEIGDVVGVFADTHTFTAKELVAFDIVDVTDSEAEIQAAIPEVKAVFKAKTTEWTDERPEEKRVWTDPVDGLDKELVKEPKYTLSYNQTTKEFEHNLSRDADNLTPMTIVKAEIVVEK